MLNLIKRAQRQQEFFTDTTRQRLKEERDYESNKNSIPPAFNKMLYSVQGSGEFIHLFFTHSALFCINMDQRWYM